MTYQTLMVHMELGRSNAAALGVAGDLAARFDAAIIAIAACQPMRVVYGDGLVTGDLFQLDRDEIDRQMAETEAEFRAALGSRAGRLEWRSAVTSDALSAVLACEARSADLVITAAAGPDSRDESRRMNVADFVMQAGRPILAAPAAATGLKLNVVLLAWKETRETRRAAFDALPILKMAARVVVVEIAPEDELPECRKRLDDVAQWLAHHGVVAECHASRADGDDACALGALAAEHGADVMVAGAYGHSRLREWALGGVTQDLLLRPGLCSLISH